ncbi:MAG TPA: ABC transporter substrate-binding protein [Hyphomicrobiaceae bacterium]|nr:ABC transporter substrate-binding protein [Hyphomicrobiaceae bacterium]
MPAMRGILSALAMSALLAATAAAAQPPRRVVSINLCTDQLALALADPGQIAALSYLSRLDSLSFLAGKAAAFRAVRGTAEEVLKLAPDLVLAGAYSSAATRMALATHAVPMATFTPVTTVAEARAEIARAAALLGHPERGSRLVSEIDRVLAEATPPPGPPLQALQMQRRGFASGRETLIADLMRRLGIANAADALGIVSVERVSLELALKARPDLLILQDEDRPPADQGAALLSHPALAAVVPPERRAFLPYREITCAGPALPAAIRRLSGEVRRIRAALAAGR